MMQLQLQVHLNLCKPPLQCVSAETPTFTESAKDQGCTLRQSLGLRSYVEPSEQPTPLPRITSTGSARTPCGGSVKRTTLGSLSSWPSTTPKTRFTRKGNSKHCSDSTWDNRGARTSASPRGHGQHAGRTPKGTHTAPSTRTNANRTPP